MTYEPVTLEHLMEHQGWALRVARRLVREEGEAEDLVQRTWMAALRRPPASERGARAWIRKVILNLARERHRRNETRRRHEVASIPLDAHAPDVFESASQAEIRALLGEHLMALSEPYRSTLVQRFYDGLTSVEIARKIGIPEGTVRWRLKVGLDQMRTELDRKSHGDRSRWMSALLVFAPAGSVPEEPEPPAPRAGEAAATASSWLASAVWVALVGAGLVGGFLWLRTDTRGASSALALRAAETSADSPPTDDDRPTSAEPVRQRLAEAPAAPSAPAAAPASLGLALRVVDEAGKAQPGARIELLSAAGYEERATCDEAGRATLAVRAEDIGALGLRAVRGRVSLRARSDGHAASALLHAAPPFTDEHEVTLVVGGPEYVRRGRILDEHGAPVADALVAWIEPQNHLERAGAGDFTGPSFVSARSDSEGRFTLRHLAAGKANIGCFAPGFAMHFSPVLRAEDERELELGLRRGATVSGELHLAGGAPAAGVRVGFEPTFKASEWATGLPHYDFGWRGFGEATRTDEQGRYRLEGVMAGSRTLWARDETGGRVVSTTLSLADGVAERWDGVLLAHDGFRLRLVDEAQRPLEGWTVHIRRQETGNWWIRRRESDAEGRVEIADCPDAEAFLDVFDPSGAGASYAQRRVRPGPQEELVVVPTRATSSVEGTVLDASGAPELRGELVFYSVLTTLSFPIERDARGAFTQRLAPGRYVLALKLEHDSAVLAQIALQEGERLALGERNTPELGTLRLDGAALRNGSARTPGYSLFALLGEDDDARAFAVGNGSLEDEVLLSLFAGRYRVLAFDGAGGAPLVRVVTVTPSAETRVELAR